MAAGLFACCATVFSPAIVRLFSHGSLFALENPSTIEMAVIGLGTIGVYKVGKRCLQSVRPAGLSADSVEQRSGQEKDGRSREAA
jgi:hypothetical protein